jgi:hypothetical protein
MISNKNFINYKILDLVELYIFNIKFVFIRLYLKKDMNLYVLHLFLRTVDPPLKFDFQRWFSSLIFRDSWHKQPSLKVAFSEAILLTEPPLNLFLEADFLMELPLKINF